MSKSIITENITPDIKGTSLALGFFDGIHIAHQKVLENALKYSRELGTKSVVITFKNHPSQLLHNLKYDFITTNEERIEIFKEMGFDVIIMCDFTQNLASMSAQEYFNNILMNLEPKSISIGYNHKFGANKSGDFNFLQTKSKEHDFILDVTKKITLPNEATISSTYIKGQIKSGDVEAANRILFKPYSLKNTVISGMQRGKLLGFPTANIEFPEKKIVPHFGVYAGLTTIDGKEYPSLANVGIRPTFNDLKKPLTEIHILELNENLYKKVIEFKFEKKIRNEIKFSTPDALCEQILSDKKQAVAFFNKQHV